MAPINNGGGGRRQRFTVAPLRTPHALSTATADGPSATEKLLHHYSASSDPFPLARAGQLTTAVYDRIWPCLEKEERETCKKERKRVGRRGRNVGTVRERADGGGEVVVIGGGRR